MLDTSNPRKASVIVPKITGFLLVNLDFLGFGVKFFKNQFLYEKKHVGNGLNSYIWSIRIISVLEFSKIIEDLLENEPNSFMNFP